MLVGEEMLALRMEIVPELTPSTLGRNEIWKLTD